MFLFLFVQFIRRDLSIWVPRTSLDCWPLCVFSVTPQRGWSSWRRCRQGGLFFKNSHTLPDSSGKTQLSLRFADSSLIEDSSSAMVTANRALLLQDGQGSDVIQTLMFTSTVVNWRCGLKTWRFCSKDKNVYTVVARSDVQPRKIYILILHPLFKYYKKCDTMSIVLCVITQWNMQIVGHIFCPVWTHMYAFYLTFFVFCIVK